MKFTAQVRLRDGDHRTLVVLVPLHHAPEVREQVEGKGVAENISRRRGVMTDQVRGEY